jgi:hypothetical protein
VHKSRLCNIVVDCHGGSMADASRFWGEALGLDPDPDDKPGDRYFGFTKATASGVRILLQRVEDESAFHLDFETDDLEAEVRRLEALGATRKRRVSTWVVMRAPTGHDFCVVERKRGALRDESTTWP